MTENRVPDVAQAASSAARRVQRARCMVAKARTHHDAYLYRLGRSIGGTDVLTPAQRDHLETLNAVRERACDELEDAQVELLRAHGIEVPAA